MIVNLFKGFFLQKKSNHLNLCQLVGMAKE